MRFTEHHQETEPLGLSPLEHVAIQREACLMEGESEDDQAAHRGSLDPKRQGDLAVPRVARSETFVRRHPK
jgi:hypothetical protein